MNLNDIFIIAEIGVNHNGKLETAKELIQVAAKSGANAVKFQSFKAKNLATVKTPKVAYQKRQTNINETHFQMLSKLELSNQDLFELKQEASANNVTFMSTPYDVESAKYLLEIDVEVFKTASADIVDIDLHEFLATTGIPVIISTGMATLGEIERALSIYNLDLSDLTLLHCVSNYPCSENSINLQVINTLKNSFDLRVGYSDHAEDNLSSLTAAALGVNVFERHLTLNKNMDGPDHASSSNPEEFRTYVSDIKRVKRILGQKRKMCQTEEKEMKNISRKSIFASNFLHKGHILTKNDFVFRRPGIGISPMHRDTLLGKKLKRTVNKEDFIMWDDLE